MFSMDTVNLILESFTGYFDGKRFFVLFLLCLIFIIFYAKGSVIMKNTVSYSAILLVVIFCPITAYIIMYDIIGKDVYWRMFWLLPATFVVGYAFCVLIKKHWLFVIPLIAALVFCGNNLYLQNRIELPQNFYKTDNEVVELIELVKADAVEDAGIRVCFPEALYCQVRQVDATIFMPYGRNAEKNNDMSAEQKRLYKMMESEDKDYKKLKKLLKKNDCQYVVLSNYTFSADMEAVGFETVGMTENYRVYSL